MGLHANDKLLEYKYWLHQYDEDELALGYRSATVRRLFNYLGLGTFSETASVGDRGYSTYFNIASNYRSFDPRLLQIKYNIPLFSSNSWRIMRFLFFLFRVFLILISFLVVLLAFLGYWGVYHFNFADFYFFSLPGWYFSTSDWSSVWLVFSQSFLYFMQTILLYLQTLNEWCYSIFLQFFILIEGRDSWELFFWGGHDKYILREALFDLIGDIYITNLALSLFTVSIITFLQIYLLFFVFKFLLLVSDMWNLTLNLSQPADWDVQFLNVESINQVMDLDLTQTLLRPGVLNNFLKYYKLGYIDNELAYFNTLEKLLFSSRATFFGYRGFLNLFPTKDTVFNFNRILKKKILPDWWFRVFDFSTTYFTVGPMLAELHRVPLSRNFTEGEGWLNRSIKTYNIFPISTFASLKRVDVVSKRFPLLLRFAFRLFFGQVDSTARADAERLKELIRPNFNVFWDLKEDDVDDVYSKWHSFEASDNVFDWYSRELEFVTTNSFLRKNFRSVQRKNFRYGLYNLVGNYAFFRKQINYNAVFAHEELDSDNHPFDAEDSMEGLRFPTDNQYVVLPDGEDEVEEPDEEDPQFEEESEDFYKEFLFEDGFLHIDQESVDTLLPEDEVSVDELMAEETLIDTKTIQFPEDEEVFATEEEEWREDVMDIFLTQVGRCPNFWRSTPDSAYWGKAEIEFGTVRNYRERVFDTIYDDVADFFWLNSDSQNVVSFSTFSRGRVFTDLNTRGWRKAASLLYLYRKLMGRVSYVRPQINTNFAFLTVPFYLVGILTAFFWWFLLAYLFIILLNLVVFDLLFFDISFKVLFAANLLLASLIMFVFSIKVFPNSFLNFFLEQLVSISSLLFSLIVLSSMGWNLPYWLTSFNNSNSGGFSPMRHSTDSIPKPSFAPLGSFLTNNNYLEVGFFARSFVNKDVLNFMVFSSGSQFVMDCRRISIRAWNLSPSSQFLFRLQPRDIYPLSSFHDLRVMALSISSSSTLVGFRDPSHVTLVSYCTFPAKLSAESSLLPSNDVLGEVLWKQGLRSVLSSGDSWCRNYSIGLEKYFALNLTDRRSSKEVKNLFSRFFFATHARRMAHLDLVSVPSVVASNFSESDTLSNKILKFASPSVRKRAAYLEPRYTQQGDGHMGISEVGRLFLSQNLLERLYSEQVSGGTIFKGSEQLFYAQTFGFGVHLGEVKLPYHKY